MKFSGKTNSLIYITAMFLCIKLCNCFFITRLPHDVIDFLDGQKCISESVPLENGQRCECKNGNTIASEKNNVTVCIMGTSIDDGKNTNLPYHLMQYFFLFHKIS